MGAPRVALTVCSWALVNRALSTAISLQVQTHSNTEKYEWQESPLRRQATPTCAWSTDAACPTFEVGVLKIGQLGVDACPAGSSPIRDSATCQQAAVQIGAPWSPEGDFEFVEGEECFWCGGCNTAGAVLLHSSHGYLAKWICLTDGATVQASATGDPHLQNLYGEKFDLMKSGNHTLIHIPRGARSDETLLRVGAEARQLGKQCGDMYFQTANISGAWAEAKRAGGYYHSVFGHAVEDPEWVTFGKVAIKIVHGRTDNDIKYLNVYVKHLGQSGFAVGGLLGEDDHEEAAAPPEACLKRVSLKKGAQSILRPAASIAVANRP